MQYHAAIRQNLRDRWTDGNISRDEIEAIDTVLHAKRPASGKPKPSQARTSAPRAKSVQPQQISALVSVLLSKSTPIRQIAVAMLEHGAYLVTRPCEFLTIKPDPWNDFFVRSAKCSETNGRGLQQVRIVPTNGYEALEIAELKAICILIYTERAKAAATASLLRRCQRAIRLARKEMSGRSRHVAAYTVRHQGRANYAAMGMAPDAIAVLMNHASAMTSQSYYAPARRG